MRTIVVAGFVAVLATVLGGWATAAVPPPPWTPATATTESWRPDPTDELPTQPAVRSRGPACTGTDTTWRNADRPIGVELQAYRCPTDADAAYLVGGLRAQGGTAKGPAIFGDPIDRVQATPGVPTPCALTRWWAQGTRAFGLSVVSPALDGAACRDLNARLSADLARSAPGTPAPAEDVSGERFSSVLALPSQLMGLIGLTVFVRWCRRTRWPVPPSGAPFTDVRWTAVRLAWVARLWAMVRAVRIAGFVVAPILIIVAATRPSVTTGVVGVLIALAAWATRWPMARLDRDHRAIGVDQPRRRRWSDPRALVGTALRVLARSTAVAAVGVYLCAAVLNAIGGATALPFRVAAARLDVLPMSDYTPGDWLRFAILQLAGASLFLVLLLLFVAMVAARFVDRVGAALRVAPAPEVLDAHPDGPYVLYLRNFGDDRARITASSQLTERGAMFEFSLLRRVRFEELLVRRIGRRMPVVALPHPRAVMPTLGAARHNVHPGEHWEDLVARLGRSATAVVVSAAPEVLGEGLLRELTLIEDGLGEGRLLFVLPPARPRELARRWRAFRQALGTRWFAEGLDAAAADGSAQVLARIDGRWHGWGSRARGEASYSASVDGALQAALPSWSRDPTPPRPVPAG